MVFNESRGIPRSAPEPTDLEELRLSAIERAKRTGDLADIEKAAAISKSIADERKAASEVAAADRSYRVTRMQSLLSSALTIISVLGLIATSLYNIAQLENTRYQEETTEWRGLLSSIEKSEDRPNGIADDVTIPFRLRSFAKSPRYNGEARLLASIVMSKMADFGGFRHLFGFIFPEGTQKDIQTLSEIASQQTLAFNKVGAACDSRSQFYNFGTNVVKNICFGAYSDKQVRDFGVKNDDQALWEMRRRYFAIGQQMNFISGKIADYMKNYEPGTAPVILRDVHLTGVDLTGVTFKNVNISGMILDGVILKGAILAPIDFAGVQFISSDWWDAKSVNQNLLYYLINYFYPHQSDYYGGVIKRPTESEYSAGVMALCRRSHVDCSMYVIKYQTTQSELGQTVGANRH